MISIIVKTILLVYFFQLFVGVVGQSPCSNYFRYIQDDVSNEVIGYIEIPFPPRGVILQLSVTLSIAVALPSVNWAFKHYWPWNLEKYDYESFLLVYISAASNQI